MNTIYAELDFESPDAARSALRAGRACFLRHRVALKDSALVHDGRRLLARFDAPDAESVRLSLRLAGFDAVSVWAP
jgi:hypothetical protein